MTGWKTLTRAGLSGLYRYSGAMCLHEAIARWAGQQFMTILVLHRVTDAIPEDGLTISTARFRRLCRLLATRFHVLPLAEVFRILREGELMPHRAVAITFDDSYQDNLRAARLLADHGLPATFFVPTGYINTTRVFEWDRSLPAMPHLRWDDLREMVRLGFEIGSHSVTHANFAVLSPEQARQELVVSRQVLAAELGQPIRWFAYPFGGREHYRPEYVPLIAEAGYEGAVSAFGGFVRPGMDDRVLPRLAVPYFRSNLHLEAVLSGCLHWLYALKRNSPDRAGLTPCPYGEYAQDERQPVILSQT